MLSCDEENSLEEKEEWVLTSFNATTTSCCFSVDSRENSNDRRDSHPLLVTLLGLEDQEVPEISLVLGKVSSFSILKNGYPVMSGLTQIDRQTLWLKHYPDSLEIKVLMKTADTLILSADGYECGIRKVKMTYYRRN